MSQFDKQVQALSDSGKITGWERITELRQKIAEVERVVVLVHGTFAARSCDVGDAWWQTEGEFRQEFTDEPGTFIIGFNWSGANSEYLRRLAGIRLWVLLLQIEALDRPYVLVCHSHGGMVCWNALRQSCIWIAGSGIPRRRMANPFASISNAALPIEQLSDPEIPKLCDESSCNLPRLRAWVTIGTPFLKHRPRTPATLWVIYALGIIYLIFGWFYFKAIKDGYDLATGLAMKPFEWWDFLLFSGILAMPYLLIGVALMLMVRRYNHLVFTFDGRTEDAIERFSARHTPIWSRNDEAINSLRVLTQQSGRILPRILVGEDRSVDSRDWVKHDRFLRRSNIRMVAFCRMVLRTCSASHSE